MAIWKKTIKKYQSKGRRSLKGGYLRFYWHAIKISCDCTVCGSLSCNFYSMQWKSPHWSNKFHFIACNCTLSGKCAALVRNAVIVTTNHRRDINHVISETWRSVELLELASSDHGATKTKSHAIIQMQRNRESLRRP